MSNDSAGPPFPLHRRLGFMADAMASAKVGPKSRFFSRERVDEIVLLLREAEKRILDVQQDLRVAEMASDICVGCGAASAMCLYWKMHGKVACCLDCQHGKPPSTNAVDPSAQPRERGPRATESETVVCVMERRNGVSYCATHSQPLYSPSVTECCPVTGAPFPEQP